MIDELSLPECNTHWGKGVWPFFQPEVVSQGEGRQHYLGEDWAFSYRLARIGVTPMADTSIRLWHYGRYGYGWEDVGIESKRFATYTHRLSAHVDNPEAARPRPIPEFAGPGAGIAGVSPTPRGDELI